MDREAHGARVWLGVIHLNTFNLMLGQRFMASSALLTQLLQRIKLATGFSLTTLQSHQQYKTGLSYEEIQKKDISTLDEAALYVGIDPETIMI